MKTSKRIYVLTHGAYESRGIVGLFSTPDALEKAKQLYPDPDYNDTEIWELDRMITSPPFFSGAIEKSGAVSWVDRSRPMDGGYKDGATLHITFNNKGPRIPLILMIFRFHAPTEARAIARAQRMRRRFIKSGEWARQEEEAKTKK